jgi:hypothetical protein
MSAPHHPYDRAVGDAWRDSVVDVVEVLCGYHLPPGTQPSPTRLEQGQLEVDGLVADPSGGLIHVEFQTRSDTTLGLRMARYWTALVTDLRSPPPEQHVVLLHPDADAYGIGFFQHGEMHLTYEVHRLWEIEPENLLARTSLLRFAPLAQASNTRERLELAVRAARLIRQQLEPDAATQALYWTAQLANLYLDRAQISDVLERGRMPIDLSHIQLVVETRRDDLRRVAVGRFEDQALAQRISNVPVDLIDDALDLIGRASPEELATWLEQHGA